MRKENKAQKTDLKCWGREEAFNFLQHSQKCFTKKMTFK